MGEYKGLSELDLEPTELKDWKSDALRYAVEIKEELEHREREEGEMPLAGEKSSSLYSKKFSKGNTLSVFKADVLKNILEREDNGDRQELIKAFIDDEIEEYQRILEQKDKLFHEMREAREKDSEGYQAYLELSKYYEIAIEKIKKIKSEIEFSEGEKRKKLRQDLEKTEEEANGFENERFNTLYGRKMKEIYDLISEVKKRTGGRGLKFVEDRNSRLREIQSHT